MSLRESGQSLMEVIVAAAVGTLVVAALTFATIFSLRNATLAKTSAQATKLAQEGIEKVRTIRDRDGQVTFTAGSTTVTKFSDLWGIPPMGDYCHGRICYFILGSSRLNQSNATDFEILTPFKRQIIIEDGVPYDQQKKITVTVSWKDTAGDHESRLTTILRKL